ncbi:MAG: DUF2196 domain-containing protein [Methanosarcina sp.]
MLKQSRRIGNISQGVIKRILTSSSPHPHETKIQLTDGQVGKVKEFLKKFAAHYMKCRG